MSMLKRAYGGIVVMIVLLVVVSGCSANLDGNARPLPALLAPGRAVGAPQAVAPQAVAPQAVAEQVAGPLGEVSGVAQPGDAVRVTQGETLIGQTVAGKDGAWSLAIPPTASKTEPFHVQIVPYDGRGAMPENPVTIVVVVVVGTDRVEVRVQVTSPNGQVDILVQTPINPCDSQGGDEQNAQPQDAQTLDTQTQDAQSQDAQPVAAPTAVPAYHQVVAGETVATIAAHYGVTGQAIMQANKLRNANLIYVGQRLVIPGQKGLQK
jgi:LysM repeat protein